MDNLLDVCLKLDIELEDDAEFGRHVRSQLIGFKQKYDLVLKLLEYDALFCPHVMRGRLTNFNRFTQRSAWNKSALTQTSIHSLNKTLAKVEQAKNKAENETTRT
jgi:hypothetical protein